MKHMKNALKEKIGEEKYAKVEKANKVFKVIKNVVCWTMVVVLVFLVISFLIERINGGTPSVFGYTVFRVETASMDPALKVGDVILSKEIANPNDIQKGDIITFKGDARFNYNRVTHRVFTAPYINEAGEEVLVTKGDANEINDGEIAIKDVMSKMQCKLGFLTGLYAFFFSPWGLIIFVALLLLIFFDEVMNLIHLSTGRYDEKEEEESIGDIIERIKREDTEKQRKSHSAHVKHENHIQDKTSRNNPRKAEGEPEKETEQE